MEPIRKLPELPELPEHLEANFDCASNLTTQLTTDENGNLVLDFPDEILHALNWTEGDLLGIEIFAGRVIFRKVG